MFAPLRFLFPLYLLSLRFLPQYKSGEPAVPSPVLSVLLFSLLLSLFPPFFPLYLPLFLLPV